MHTDCGILDLRHNHVPEGYTMGRSKWVCFLWLIVQNTVFNWLPRPCYRWRSFLLSLFGAKIGRNVRIRPNVTVEFPWRLVIGDNSSIGDHAWIYNLAPVIIGENCVVSQYAKLVTGSHDISSRQFMLMTGPIVIENGAWIGADAFVGPGVNVKQGAVLGACCCTFSDISAWEVFIGTKPCFLRQRIIT